MKHPERTDAEESQGVWYCCGTANVLPGKKYVYSGPMATYCMWHRPIAVYAPAEQKTFFVFGNARNSPTISYYDHRRRGFAAPVVLGANPDMDAHRNPTILVDETGRLYVFYGAHGHPTRVLKSASPFDISEWNIAAEIEDPATSYPQPYQLKAGEIFVSYRQSPGWSCRISRDGAASWDAPVNLIKFDGCAVYAISIAETGPYPRKIHIAWSRLGGGTPEEIEAKHLWARRYNVYYAYSDDGGTTWRKRDGTPYTLPITEATAEKLYDCGEHGVWLKDIQLDADGNPYILFIDAEIATFESAWKLAKHSDGQWQIRDVATSDHMYDGGALVVLADDDFRIYAPTTASQPQEDGGEIEEWRSIDKGETWTNAEHITSGSPYSHNQVKVVFNHQKGSEDLRVLWSYGDSDYPPATKNVDLYCYGEGKSDPRRITFPQSPERAEPDQHAWRKQMRPLLRMDNGEEITDLAAWNAHREEIKKRTLRCYGNPPDERPELAIERTTATDCGTYIRHTISFLSEPADPVKAYLCIPKGLTEKAPGVLAIHSTTPIGKDQPAGLGGDKNRHYGKELAQRGYVVLIPDEIVAGERLLGGATPWNTAPFYKRHPEWSALGKAIWDSRLFVDVLCAQKEVDVERLACIGHSQGAIYTILTLAFDDRVKAGIASCGFRPYFADPEGAGKEGRGRWCRDRGWVGTPHLRELFKAGKPFPYDVHELVALAVPRAVFFHAARGDNKGNCSTAYYCSAMQGAFDEISKVYEFRSALARQFLPVWSAGGHDFPPEVREQAYEWLDLALRNK